MSNGLIDKAFLSGTHNPDLFYRKYPTILRKPKGGYEIQSTPQEVAGIISMSRSWVKGHRMLCVGTETLGAERFLAENLGMMDVEYIGQALPGNAAELKAKEVKAPTGTYDVITVYGTAKVDAILPFTRIGTLIVFIGVGPNAKNPDLRQAWLSIRKKHMTMLQTGGESWQTGVGVVKILFVAGQDKNPPVVILVEKEEQDEEWETEQDENAQSDGVPDAVLGGGKSDSGSGNADEPKTAPEKKRRGRQPGSKNKVKA